MAEENGRWVTIHGTHVFIKRGETLDDAIARLSDNEDRPNYIHIQKAKYGYYWDKIIREDDLESYEIEGWFKHREQPDMVEALDFVDNIDIEGRDVDNIMEELYSKYRFSYVREFLKGKLEERIAEYQEKLAKRFLSDSAMHSGRHLMSESIALDTNPNYEESRKLRLQGSHDREAANYTLNCQRCVQAFVLKWCHGYDVEAMPCDRVWSDKEKAFVKGPLDQRLSWYTAKNGYKTLKNGSASYYNNWQCAIFNAADVRETHVDAYDIEREIGYAGTEDQYRWIKRTVKAAGPGACYIACVSWKGTRDDTGRYDAHVFCIINENGKVKCIDPQTGVECSEYFTDKQIKSNRTELFRADTCRLNGVMMGEIVKKWKH